jgi:hypothetical protein
MNSAQTVCSQTGAPLLPLWPNVRKRMSHSVWDGAPHFPQIRCWTRYGPAFLLNVISRIRLAEAGSAPCVGTTLDHCERVGHENGRDNEKTTSRGPEHQRVYLLG